MRAKFLVARLVLILTISTALPVLSASPAAAHGGGCTITADTWHEGFWNPVVYGYGNVNCNGFVHDKMFIRVTLQVATTTWTGVSTAEKTLFDVSHIYKQTDYDAGVWGRDCEYRVRIFYNIWNNGILNHSDVVYRAQEPHPC